MAQHFVHQRGGRVAIARAVRAEQHHAVAVGAVRVGIDPVAGDVQAHHRLDPAGTIKIRPLVGEAQMRLDDAAADRLEVRHAGVAAQVLARPGAAPVLDLRHRFGVDQPVVERAARSGGAGGVPPPARLAIDQRHVGADMRAGQQRAPEVTGGQCRAVFLGRGDDLAAGAHAAQVHDRLGEHRERRRHHAVRCGLQALRQGDRELVVDPAMCRGTIPRNRDLRWRCARRAGSRHARNTGTARDRPRRSALSGFSLSAPAAAVAAGCSANRWCRSRAAPRRRPSPPRPPPRDACRAGTARRNRPLISRISEKNCRSHSIGLPCLPRNVGSTISLPSSGS